MGQQLPMWEWHWPHYGTHLYDQVGFFTHPEPDIDEQTLYLPYWLLTASVAILPVFWSCLWWRKRRKTARRHKAGLCPTCGYDLRASLDRCPECGTPVPIALARKPVA